MSVHNDRSWESRENTEITSSRASCTRIRQKPAVEVRVQDFT